MRDPVWNQRIGHAFLFLAEQGNRVKVPDTGQMATPLICSCKNEVPVLRRSAAHRESGSLMPCNGAERRRISGASAQVSARTFKSEDLQMRHFADTLPFSANRNLLHKSSGAMCRCFSFFLVSPLFSPLSSATPSGTGHAWRSCRTLCPLCITPKSGGGPGCGLTPSHRRSRFSARFSRSGLFKN